MTAAPLNLFDRRMIAGLEAALGELAAEAPRALLVRADDAIRTEATEPFESEDLQKTVRTFFEHGGPGQAKFDGR